VGARVHFGSAIVRLAAIPALVALALAPAAAQTGSNGKVVLQGAGAPFPAPPARIPGGRQR